VSKTEHLAGRPVSAHTYRRLGCRCDGCTAAATAAVRKQRAASQHKLARIEQRAIRNAGAWVRRTMPAEWQRFMDEAYDWYGFERRPRGRPRGS
jgi:hypothetical protein